MSKGRRFTRWLRLVALLSLTVGGRELSAQHTVTYSQVVTPADPSLQWMSPSPIPFGEPLTSAQLSATAAVPGTFTYTPTLGKLLQPGTQSLNVKFTPASTNFFPSNATVTITVTPPGSSNFSFRILTSDLPSGTISLSRGAPLTLSLTVAPIGDFHQPVTFSCVSPRPEIQCVFTPDTVRAARTPVRVELAINYNPIRGKDASQRPIDKTHGLIVIAGLVAFTRRRRRPSSVQGALFLSYFARFAAPLLLICAALSGCGFDPQHEPISQAAHSVALIIRATSLAESRQVDLNLTLKN